MVELKLKGIELPSSPFSDASIRLQCRSESSNLKLNFFFCPKMESVFIELVLS
jgi:hypothetical protein